MGRPPRSTGTQRREQGSESQPLGAAQCRHVAVPEHLGRARLRLHRLGLVVRAGPAALARLQRRLSHGPHGIAGRALARALEAEPRGIHLVVALEVGR